jgi:hypothetical protein
MQEALMNAREKHNLIALLREVMILRAETSALANILDVAEETGKVPVNWRSILKETRSTHVYRNVSEQHERLFQHIEQTSDDAAIEEMLRSISAPQLAV